MKKLVLLTALFLGLNSITFAQKGGTFTNGDNLINIGIGVGTPYFGSGYSSSFPVNPTISYEKGITDAISVGGELSFASSKYSYLNYSFKESAVYIGARGSYHFNDLLEIPSPFDFYGGASLGVVAVSVSDNTGYTGAANSGLGLGIFAGGKYYFQSNTAVYAELGYQSLSYLNIGISFKF